MVSCMRAPQIQTSRTKAIHWFHIIFVFIFRVCLVRAIASSSTPLSFHYFSCCSSNGGLRSYSRSTNALCDYSFTVRVSHDRRRMKHDTSTLPSMFICVRGVFIVVAGLRIEKWNFDNNLASSTSSSITGSIGARHTNRMVSRHSEKYATWPVSVRPTACPHCAANFLLASHKAYITFETEIYCQTLSECATRCIPHTSYTHTICCRDPMESNNVLLWFAK